MKKSMNKVIASLLTVIPALAVVAMNVSANSIASPTFGQPAAPESLKAYRKF